MYKSIIINILLKHGMPFKDKGSWVQICNPWVRDTKYHLGIEVDKGFFNCFKSGESGTITTFVSRLENCSMDQANTILGINSYDAEQHMIQRIDFLQQQYKKKLEKKKQIVLDNELTSIALPDNSFPIDKNIYAMQKPYQFLMRKVGSEKIIDKMKAFYCTKGEWKNFLIMPYYVYGKIVYYIGRNLDQKSDFRYKYPKNEELNKEKSSYLYNYDNVLDKKIVIICEGAFNSLVVGGVALGGKDISQRQIDYLLRIPEKKGKKFIVALDQDIPGKKAIIPVCEKLKKFNLFVYFFNLPRIIKYDFADIGSEKSIELLCKYTHEATTQNYVQLTI